MRFKTMLCHIGKTKHFSEISKRLAQYLIYFMTLDGFGCPFLHFWPVLGVSPMRSFFWGQLSGSLEVLGGVLGVVLGTFTEVHWKYYFASQNWLHEYLFSWWNLSMIFFFFFFFFLFSFFCLSLFWNNKHCVWQTSRDPTSNNVAAVIRVYIVCVWNSAWCMMKYGRGNPRRGNNSRQVTTSWIFKIWDGHMVSRVLARLLMTRIGSQLKIRRYSKHVDYMSTYKRRKI